tara:strand:+ start:241 stop:1011 length:771 start_codon:yes stop_codon:yes gene_type:complete
MKINFAKNLLIIATLVLLSSCEVEDTSGYNCIPGGCVSDVTGAQYSTLEECQVGCDGAYINNDPIDPSDQSWGWSMTLDGNTFAEACDEETFSYSSYGSIQSGTLSFTLDIDDITDECYITGDYTSISFGFNSPFVGPNVNTTLFSTGYFNDYFSSNYLGGRYYTGFSETPIDSTLTNDSMFQNLNKLTIEISSLGTGISFDPNTSSQIFGERLVGSYSGTIYKVPNDFEYVGFGYLPYTQPVSLEINFSLIRIDN